MEDSEWTPQTAQRINNYWRGQKCAWSEIFEAHASEMEGFLTKRCRVDFCTHTSPRQVGEFGR